MKGNEVTRWDSDISRLDMKVHGELGNKENGQELESATVRIMECAMRSDHDTLAQIHLEDFFNPQIVELFPTQTNNPFERPWDKGDLNFRTVYYDATKNQDVERHLIMTDVYFWRNKNDTLNILSTERTPKEFEKMLKEVFPERIKVDREYAERERERIPANDEAKRKEAEELEKRRKAEMEAQRIIHLVNTYTDPQFLSDDDLEAVILEVQRRLANPDLPLDERIELERYLRDLEREKEFRDREREGREPIKRDDYEPEEELEYDYE